MFLRLFDAYMLDYKPNHFVGNFSYYDRVALGWLRRNAHTFLVADSDKCLGEVVCERSWALSTSLHHLSVCANVITITDYHKLVR